MVIPLILLAAIVTTPFMITEDAFARYQRHTDSDLKQAASISNSCLNPISTSNTNNNMISNGNCGGTISQQGRSGQASTPTIVQNANPTIEVQRSTATVQPPLTTTEDKEHRCDILFRIKPYAIRFEEIMSERSLTSDFGVQLSTIPQLCAELNSIASSRDIFQFVDATDIVEDWLRDAGAPRYMAMEIALTLRIIFFG
jgi:hypothetical protein